MKPLSNFDCLHYYTHYELWAEMVREVRRYDPNLTIVSLLHNITRFEDESF